MKRILLITTLFSSLITYSQNLTFDQILSLRKKNLDSAEEYLSSHGWSFYEGKEPDSSHMGTATFSYKKTNYSDTSESFLYFIYNEVSGYDYHFNGKKLRRRVEIQFLKKEIYNSYLARIKSFGCKLVKSEIKNNSIEKTYQGATTTIRIRIVSSKDDYYSNKTTYEFLIYDNDDHFMPQHTPATNPNPAKDPEETESSSDEYFEAPPAVPAG